MLPDLTAITLTLRPRKFNRIPYWQGRAAQALLYSTLHRLHPYVSETIHDLHKWQPIMPKPFTMSSIMGAKHDGDTLELNPDNTVNLSITTLHPQMSGVTLNGVLPIWQREGITLHDQPMWIVHTERTITRYEDLLGGACDNPMIEMRFTSPTAFKQTGGGVISDPSSKYIFSSLFNRWNSFAPTPLPDELENVIEKRLKIVDCDVQYSTLSFARGRKGIVRGFYGTVVLAVKEASAELRQMLNALMLFAQFSGIGIKTTVGMGRVT